MRRKRDYSYFCSKENKQTNKQTEKEVDMYTKFEIFFCSFSVSVNELKKENHLHIFHTVEFVY